MFILNSRRRQWHLTPVLLPGKSHGWRSLVGCSPWGHEELDTTERLHFHFSLLCVGEEKATHSSVLAWRIPGTGEPGGLPSTGSHRVGHDWSNLAAAAYWTLLWCLLPCLVRLLPVCFSSILLLKLLFLITWYMGSICKHTWSVLSGFFFSFWLHHESCEILVPWSEVETRHRGLTSGPPGFLWFLTIHSTASWHSLIWLKLPVPDIRGWVQ